MSEAPKIHIDTDWKSQAQREKERLAAQERSTAGAAATTASTRPAAAAGPAAAAAERGRSDELPPASWDTLVATVATQAIMYLGGASDPRTGQPMVDLDVARHQIDLLSVLEEKTRGNLSDDESRQLALIAHDLRTRYVQVAQATVPTVAEALRGSSQTRANNG